MNRLKKWLIGVLISLPILMSGQIEGQTYQDESESLIWNSVQWDTLIVDIDSVCAERGHIMTSGYSITLMYCPSYIVDYDNYSEEVFPVCNDITSNCRRCGIKIVEQGTEIRIVIWRKDDE